MKKPPGDRAVDDWDRHWGDYAASASSNPAQRMRHDLVVDALLRASAAGRVRIIDLGCGQGDLMVKVSKSFPSAELLGVDISREGVEVAKRKVRKATFLEADLLAPGPEVLAFGNWASHAVCSEVLEHLDDPVRFLASAGRLLQSGAILVVTVPGGRMSAFDRHIGHRRHFTRESVAQVLQRAGFDVEKVQLAGFPFFNLYRLIVIARGSKLITDVEAGSSGLAGALARVVMAFFGLVLPFSLKDSLFGRQVVAIARRSEAASQ